MSSTGQPTALPHLYSGKVRELYEVSHDRMLMVASDRVSVFDVVLPDEIPDKGRVLTGAVELLVRAHARHRRQPRDLGRPHRLPRDGGRRRGPGHARARDAADPARVRRARLPVRRRLAGVRGAGHGRRLLGARRVCARPSGCPSRSSRRRRRPSRATTCRSTRDEAIELVGEERVRSAARPLVAAVRVRRRVRATSAA